MAGTRNEPITIAVVNSHAEDEPAAPAAFEHLAPGDQPDTAPAGHHATSWSVVRGDRFHEQLRQLRRLVGERPDLAGRPGAGEQGVEIHRSVDEQLDPVADALEHGDVGHAVDPGATGADDLDLEMLAARRALERLDGARGDDPAASDDHDVLADVLDEVELVAGEDDPDAGRGPLPDDLGHRRDPDRVETRERLVEDEQLGVVDERGRQLDPLLVAVRQLLELRLRPVGETHPLEPDRCRRVGRLAPHPVLLGEVAELLGDPHPRVEPALLGHVAEAQPGVAIHDRALPAHLAAVGPGQPEDAAHRGRLARAVGAEEADDPARVGAERRAVERDHRPVAFGEIDDLEHGSASPRWPV